MKSSIAILFVVILVGIVQGLVLAVALVRTKRGNRTANRLLAGFAATVSLTVLGVCLTKLQWSPVLYSTGKIYQPISFLAAPLLFLYLKALLSDKIGFPKTNLVHFIPAALCFLYLLSYYFYVATKNEAVLGNYYGSRWYILRNALLILQFILYLALSFREAVRYRRSHAQLPALVSFKFRFLITTFGGLWILGLIHYVASVLSPTYHSLVQVDLIVPLLATVIVYALAYLGLREPDVLTVTNEVAPNGYAKKYTKSTLTAERGDEYLERLLLLMKNDRPYSDGELTLQKLARRLSISSHHLSQILNERLNQNFFDFVNSYRVEEAKRKLVEPSTRHYSILGIAEDVGFNSKSAFHNAFKKKTGMTPTEFRDSVNGTPHAKAQRRKALPRF